MNFYTSQFFGIKTAFAFLIVTLPFAGCKPRHIHKREIISFKAVQGIPYTEVSRRLTNGLIFNDYGYQLEPQWATE